MESPNSSLNQTSRLQTGSPPFPECIGHAAINFPRNKVCLRPQCRWKCLICQKCASSHLSSGHPVQEFNKFKYLTLKKISMNATMGESQVLNALMVTHQRVQNTLNQYKKLVDQTISKLQRAIWNQFQINIQTFYDETYQRQIRSLNHGVTNKKIAICNYRLQVLKRNQQQGKYVMSTYEENKYLQVIKEAKKHFKYTIEEFGKLQYVLDLEDLQKATEDKQFKVQAIDLLKETEIKIKILRKKIQAERNYKIDIPENKVQKQKQKQESNNKTQINRTHLSRDKKQEQKVERNSNKEKKNNKQEQEQLQKQKRIQKEKEKQREKKKLKEKETEKRKELRAQQVIQLSSGCSLSASSSPPNSRSRGKKQQESKSRKDQKMDDKKESRIKNKTSSIQRAHPQVSKQEKKKQQTKQSKKPQINTNKGITSKNQQAAKCSKDKQQLAPNISDSYLPPFETQHEILDDECVIYQGTKRPIKNPRKMTDQQLQAWFKKYYFQNQVYSLVLSHRSRDGYRQLYLYCMKTFKWFSQTFLEQTDQGPQINSYARACAKLYKPKPLDV